MACLTSEGTTLEIRFKNFSVGWVDCEICFLSHGQPILNENILGRHGCRENYAPSAIFANDHRECELLWVLKKVIETNLPDYWKPIEPDVIVAIYPDMAFPFLGDKYELAWQSGETRRESEERAILKAEKGVLPDDIITLMCFVDSYAFKDSEVYSGNGVSLHLIVKRHEIEKFYEELKAEYIEFKKQFKVDEHNFKELENDWEPMEL
jgi:hypothetical protein